MISKDLYVLLPEEIQQLALVDTTMQQAWQIYERNITLLKDLYCGVVDYPHFSGCPHCVPTYACISSQCKWLAVRASCYRKYACCKQTFGGLTLDETNVRYGWGDEEIGPLSYPYEDTESFLIGHIEWAQMIIDGIMPAAQQ